MLLSCMFRRSEKCSNVFKKSSRKIQLKADVKMKIKKKLLQRDKVKEARATDHAGTVNYPLGGRAVSPVC